MAQEALLLLAAVVLALTADAQSVNYNSTTSAPTCLDREGKKIDWWFIYKQPNGFGESE
jgi:hypothetical protein